MRFPKTVQALLAFFLLSAGGCSESSDTVPVSGKVTYRGQPITDGALTLFPGTGRPTTAPLTETGEYSTELPPGEYTVIVSVATKLPPGFQEGDPVPPPKVVLPPEYTTRVRSKLTATVSAESDQPIDFALK